MPGERFIDLTTRRVDVVDDPATGRPFLIVGAPTAMEDPGAIEDGGVENADETGGEMEELIAHLAEAFGLEPGQVEEVMAAFKPMKPKGPNEDDLMGPPDAEPDPSDPEEDPKRKPLGKNKPPLNVAKKPMAAAAVLGEMGGTIEDLPAGTPVKRGLLAAAFQVADIDPSWFEDPGLTERTPMTVTDDGRVFGHIATFGSCHVGIADRCQQPPRSASGYQFFRTGAVVAGGKQVPVGQITLGTGHADLSLGASAAVHHYDNTGTAVADVAAGEDEFGIWVAGAVRPGTTVEQVHALRASAPSGDWRVIQGRHEMVAVLAVNVPGFPVVRTLAASAYGYDEEGRIISIVASGQQGVPPEYSQFVASLESRIEKLEATQKIVRPLAASAIMDRVNGKPEVAEQS